MPEPSPNPELLRSLGRLTRGLSALFWGMPAALLISVQTVKGDWLRPWDVFPPVLANALLLYSLGLLGGFQRQERVWIAALERSRVLAVANLGLSPFLFWWSRMPTQPFYTAAVGLLVFFSLLFLFSLNPLLDRLTAMLPDEALRAETRLFTRFNRYLIVACVLVGLAYLANGSLPHPLLRPDLRVLVDRIGFLLLLFLLLLPLAMTMALLWKVKEVILVSVFSPSDR